MGPRPYVRWLVGPSVGPLVRNAFVKIDEITTLLNEIKRRKERRGGRRDEEDGVAYGYGYFLTDQSDLPKPNF